LLPLAAQGIDRQHGLTWPFSAWMLVVAVPLVAIGAALALWTVYCFAFIGKGTPNPMAPPRRLVVMGPYRFSRNPMMLGGWVLGLGLALMLRSPSLLVALGLIVIAGLVYVRVFEEPRLRKRFGAAYEEYARAAPRWIGLYRLKELGCALSHHCQNS
jgi:protein-S-isoprenylcysteine O-methyltransferase Ste14